MSAIERRRFLAQAAAVPIVYGLVDVGVGARESDPAWVGQALARMKETGRWGVVLALPPAAPERFRLGQALWALTSFENEDDDAHVILCQAVFVVTTPELAKRAFGMKDGATRLLLCPEAKTLASDAADLSVVRDPVKFASSFGAFLHGQENSRLAERAGAIEKGLSAEVKDAVAKLGSESSEEQLRAKLVLARKAEGMTPYLAHLAAAGPDERVRRRAKNLLTSYFASLRPEAPGTRLPYGCSGPHAYDPCRSCGMGRIPERSRMLFRFLVPGGPVPKEED